MRHYTQNLDLKLISIDSYAIFLLIKSVNAQDAYLTQRVI